MRDSLFSACEKVPQVQMCPKASVMDCKVKRLKSISKISIVHFECYIIEMDAPWLSAPGYFYFQYLV